MLNWIISATQDEDCFFDDYLRAYIGSDLPHLPPHHAKIGAVETAWVEPQPGFFTLELTGGTPADRWFADQYLSTILSSHGLERQVFDLEPMEKTAEYQDVEKKAVRLLQSGKVHIMANHPDMVIGMVEGDHGTYEVEIWKDAPKPNGEPSESISRWSCECLLPGTPIVMADGSIKPVEKIAAGDMVLTATGKSGMVSKTLKKQYRGTAYGMRIEGSTETVWMTDNHKLPDPKMNFKEAKDWSAGDYTFMPIIDNAEQLAEIDVTEHVTGLVEDKGWLYRPNKLYGSRRVSKRKRPPKFSMRQTPIPARITVDCSFAYVAGLFIAEGMTTPDGELRWTFNAQTEQSLVGCVIRAMARYGLNHPMIAEKASSVTVAFQSKSMAELFGSLFGTGAKTKKLHPTIMSFPTLAISSLFRGWFDGDGHKGQNGRDSLATASPHLAMQARLILARCGHESVWRTTHDNVSELVPGGTDLHVLAWRRNGGRGHNAQWLENDRVYQRMLEPQTRYYSGPVYDFEVPGDHTFVIAPGIASSNCDWGQFAWGRTRRWKRFEGRPCAHCLALYWAARSVPTEVEQIPEGWTLEPATAEGGPQGPAAQRIEQGEYPGMGGMVAPGASPYLMQPPMVPEQVQQGMPPGQAPEVLPPYPAAPENLPAINPVSVPGQKPQSPLNPVQNANGTFSSYNEDHAPWRKTSTNRAEDLEVCQDSGGRMLGMDGEQEQTDSAWKVLNRRQSKVGTSRDVRTSDWSGTGRSSSSSQVRESKLRQSQPSASNYSASQHSRREQSGGDQCTSDDMRYMRRSPHTTRESRNPSSLPQMSQGVYSPQDASVTCQVEGRRTIGGTFSHVAAEQSFTNGDMVRAKNDDIGTWVGLNGGGPGPIKAGMIGEVLGTHATTGLVNVYYSQPAEGNGPLQPHGVTIWHWPNEIDPAPGVRPPGPAIRRRR